jgi:hypothetical protein
MSSVKFNFFENTLPVSSFSNRNIKFKTIHEAFDQYYNNLSLIKTQQNGNIGIYKASISSLLSDGLTRYVVVLVNDNNSLGDTKELSELDWIVFQTRTMETKSNKENLPKYSMPNQSNVPLLIKQTRIHKEGSDSMKIKYSTSLNEMKLEVLKLNREGKEIQYNESGTLHSALELYSTIIILN